MKESSFGTYVLYFLMGLAIAWFLWIFIAGAGKQSSYDTKVSAESVQKLLAENGLKVCSKEPLELSNTPGLENARQISVSSNCEADTNPMTVSLLKFDSEAARNAALQKAATTHRNGFGPHTIYTYGPYVIAVQGTRTLADQALLDQALQSVGATI